MKPMAEAIGNLGGSDGDRGDSIASMKPMAEAIGNWPTPCRVTARLRTASMKPMAEAIGNPAPRRPIHNSTRPPQ